MRSSDINRAVRITRMRTGGNFTVTGGAIGNRASTEIKTHELKNSSSCWVTTSGGGERKKGSAKGKRKEKSARGSPVVIIRSPNTSRKIPALHSFPSEQAGGKGRDQTESEELGGERSYGGEKKVITGKISCSTLQ